jgi:hypothetical protein
MNKIIEFPCSKSVELFRGLYARVARDLGVDASYVSRVARGERKSKVAEKALNREFEKILVLIRNSSAPPQENQRKRTGRKFHHNQ